MRVINTEKIPIKLWLDNIEEGALQQAKNLANLPFAYKWISIMPDSHQGYGMPIGGVLATEGVIVPAAVGVDIGCGMCAVKTPWTVSDFNKERLVKICNKIRQKIPVGFGRHNEPQDVSFMPKIEFFDKSIVSQEYSLVLRQVGTLGGGNHFIELQKDSAGNVWVMLHSGSRNLGKKVGDHYTKRAKVANKLWHSGVPTSYDLAYLPIQAEDGKKYFDEMNFCVDFAFCNRKLMMTRISEILNKEMMHKKIDLDQMINIAHNYARWEHHYGKDVLVHRKGATSARQGETGIIPGSQGTKSYIVVGKGNPESFMSCSHGAGRRMGRKEAIRKLDLVFEQEVLNKLGVVHTIVSEKDLDEAPGSYKDIFEVMDNQKDLVTIKVELTPMAVVKG